MLLAFFAGGVSPTWADKVVLSEGFESNSLTTNGWTTSNPGSSGIYSGAKKTGSYGYRFFYYSSGGPRYLISPELTIPSNASGVNLSFYHASYSTSYGDEKFKVGYSTTTNSTDAFTWSDEQIDNSTAWKEYTDNTLPKETKYIAIQYTSGNAYYLFIDDINLTCEVSGPSLEVYDGSALISSGYNYPFGLTTAGTTKTLTLKNTGTTAHNVSVKSITGGYTAVISDGGALAATDGEVTLTIGMSSTSGDGVITIQSDDASIDDFVINVSGTVRDESKMWCNFSEGLPSGWTNSGNWSIATSGAGEGTSGNGYAYNTSYDTNKLIYSPLVTIAEGEKLYLQIKGYGSTASWNKLNIQYSADGKNWTNAKVLNSITNVWQSLEVTEIPAGNWYIGFYGSYVYFTDIYGGTESTAPVIALSQNSYDFGLIATSTTSSAITITNTGKSALTGMTVTSDNANFTVAVIDNAETIAANGGTATFNVTMAPNATGAQSATITIKSDNADDLTFTVTGAVAKEGTTAVDFNDNALPTGWSNSSSPAWSFADGAAYAGTSSWGDYATMTTSKMRISADDFLAFKVKAANSSYGTFKVYSSTDGTTFNSTPVASKSYTDLSTSDYTTVIVSGLAAGDYFFKIEGYYMYLDEVAGVVYAPTLAVTQGGNAVTTPQNYAFGELGADATVTYNFNNTGAGTLNITNVESSNAVFTTNWTETIAASDYNLIITANYNAANAGEQNGAVTVTTTEGTFVINLTSTFLAANAPTLAVDNTLDFGKLTANDTKTITVTNSGTGSMTVNIESDNDLFTVSPAQLTEIGAGASKTFDVTFHYDNVAGSYGNKSANITVTPTYDSEAAITIVTSAKAKDPDEFSEDFSGNALPDGWTVSGDTEKWTFTNGVAKTSFSSNKGYLETPLLTVATSDVLSFQAKSTFNGSVTIKVYKKAGSADWETSAFKTISLTSSDNGIWKDYTIEGLEAGNYKFKFENEDYELDNFEGFKQITAPEYSVYSDNSYANEKKVTMAESKDFGFVDEAKNVSYYIKNTGNAAMKLAAPVAQAPLTASFSDASAGVTESGEGDAKRWTIPANGTIKLNITMSNATAGEYTGKTVSVTADDEVGAFVASFNGIVTDNDYFNVDFSTEGIPGSWTNANEYFPWTKNSNGYISTTSNNATLVTTPLVATTGDKLYIQRDGNALTVKYKKTADDNWSDFASLAYSSTKKIDEMTIPEGLSNDKILLQISGSEARIYRIYGLTAVLEPHMTTTAADINFGNLTAESDEQSFTITNDGTATLEDLSVTLGKTGDDAEYSIALYDGENAFAGTELVAGKTITVKVKQLFDINKLGAKSDVLTIAATDQTPVAINLTGATRDASKYYVATPTITANKFSTSALTIAAGEVLTFDVNALNGAEFSVDYTTDGGLTWNTKDDYSISYGDNKGLQLNFENTGAVTAWVVFNVNSLATLTNVYGGVATTAPLLTLTESSTAVVSGSTKDFGTLTESDATVTYTLGNTGTDNLVSTLSKTGDITFEVTAMDEGVTKSENTLTIPTGKTATLVVTLPYAAPHGEKNGSLTISSTGWVGDMTVNYTATTVDETAVAVNFDGNNKPNGWYNGAWSITNNEANTSMMAEARDLISPKLTVSGPEDVLSYDAKHRNANYVGFTYSLTVQYSTDRKNWTDVPTQPVLTKDYQTFTVSGLTAGDYYLKFTGLQVYLDNILGWHYATPIAEHDIFVRSYSVNKETMAPGTTITASVNATSLVGSETVTAELYFGNTKVGEQANKVLNNGANNATASTTITVTGSAPAEEDTYDVYVKLTNDDITVETAKTSVEVVHTRTLSIASFTRTDGTEGLTADENNKISPAFSVTVENTGTTACTPTVKIYQGETVVATATADAAVAAGETSDAIALTATNMSAGEGGALEFTAKAFWTSEDTEAKVTSDAITINVTATAPKFALYDSENTEITDGTSYDLGIIKGTKSLNFTVKNEGNAPMLIKSITTPDGYTLPTTVQAFIAAQQAVPAMEGYNAVPVVVNLTATDGDYGKKVGDLVVTYKVDGSTDKTFTLHLSGRTVANDTWVEEFATNIPASWIIKNSNSDGWKWNEDRQTAYSGGVAGTFELITPRLAAEKNEVLTYETKWQYTGDAMTVQYSTDKKSWTDYATITANTETVEREFVAPTKGNYYLKFTANRYVNLDNFVGFKLNIPEHDTEIAASSVPTSGTQYADYTATVTLKENVGKAEEITATLYVDGVEKATKTETITANGSTVVTLTWEPDAVISTAVKAYIAVTGTGINLTTDEVDLTIDAPYELDETVGDVANASYPALVLKHSFVAGWNTICLPFTINVTDIHAEAKAFSFDAYNTETKELTFNKATELAASVPYVIYVPEAISVENPFIFKNVEIGFGYTTPDKSEHTMTFQGTYAPMTAGSLTNCCGLTAAGKIVKAKSTTTMKGFRGYFMNVPAGARVMFNGFEDDETTGIRMITIDNTAAEGTYNMQGQKVEQLKKGRLYIINGKKQVVK